MQVTNADRIVVDGDFRFTESVTDFPPCFNETATLESIVCMLQCVYEQNAELMRHVEGIENAFKTVAESTTDMMANLSESPLGGLIGRFMGRGD